MVGREHLNDNMRILCEQKGALKQPRKCLLGTYSAENIWVFSPMVQFWRSIGLEVYDVQEVVQYTPQKCFQYFGKPAFDNKAF